MRPTFSRGRQRADNDDRGMLMAKENQVTLTLHGGAQLIKSPLERDASCHASSEEMEIPSTSPMAGHTSDEGQKDSLISLSYPELRALRDSNL